MLKWVAVFAFIVYCKSQHKALWNTEPMSNFPPYEAATEEPMITCPLSAYTCVTTGWSEWTFWIRMICKHTKSQDVKHNQINLYKWVHVLLYSEKRNTNKKKHQTSDPGGSLGSNMRAFHALGWQPNQRSPFSGSTSTLSQSVPTATDWLNVKRKTAITHLS